MSEPTFGERLQAWLKAASMSQAAFARAIGISGASVNAWLAGRESPLTMRLPAIAAALGITQSQFFGPLPAPPAEVGTTVPAQKKPRRAGARGDDFAETTRDMTPGEMQAAVGEDDVEDMPDELLEQLEAGAVARGKKRGEAA